MNRSESRSIHLHKADADVFKDEVAAAVCIAAFDGIIEVSTKMPAIHEACCTQYAEVVGETVTFHIYNHKG